MLSPSPVTIVGMSTPDWPVLWKLLPDLTDDNREQVLRAVDVATGILWALTGRQYGLRAVEARPCKPEVADSYHDLTPGPGWAPYLDSGVVRNLPTCAAAPCDRSGAVLLPGPVHKLLEFLVDGNRMPLNEVHVDGDRVYRRYRPWPTQNLVLPSSELGTWALWYLRGRVPPKGADYVLAMLAKELLAAETGGTCRLPKRVQNIQRQGVTVNMVHPEDIFDKGVTGIPEVDLWVRAHNPHHLTAPAQVWSPDLGVW